MKKYLRATEYVWLVMALLCVGVTTYYFIAGDTENGVFGMVVTLFAGVMYSLRRRFNRHMQRMIEKQEKAGKKN